MDSKTFYELLFDQDDWVCYTPDVYGTAVYRRDNQYRDETNYFSVNPIDPNKDHEPTKEYHNENRPRRADCNVVKFRNILLEMDHCSIPEQKKIMSDYGIPWTTAVYSGGKSIHFIISLVDPLPRDQWRKLVDRIHKLIGNQLDSACRNPSRLSRCPNVFREDKGQMQLLLKTKERVPFKALDDLLNKFGVFEEWELTPEISDLLAKPKKELSVQYELKNLKKAVRNIIFQSDKGNKHNARTRAAYLAGGYVGRGILSESEAVSIVMEAVLEHGTDGRQAAESTVKDCVKRGIRKPIEK